MKSMPVSLSSSYFTLEPLQQDGGQQHSAISLRASLLPKSVSTVCCPIQPFVAGSTMRPDSFQGINAIVSASVMQHDCNMTCNILCLDNAAPI